MEKINDATTTPNPFGNSAEPRNRESILAELDHHRAQIERLRAQLDQLDGDEARVLHGTKYFDAIVAAGNAPLPLASSGIHRQPMTGVKFGPFAVTWGALVRLPGLAAHAAAVAAYAEQGVVEPGVTPREYVTSFLWIDPCLLRLAMEGGPLHALCRDALTRALADERFAGQHDDVSDVLDVLQGRDPWACPADVQERG